MKTIKLTIELTVPDDMSVETAISELGAVINTGFDFVDQDPETATDIGWTEIKKATE